MDLRIWITNANLPSYFFDLLQREGIESFHDLLYSPGSVIEKVCISVPPAEEKLFFIEVEKFKELELKKIRSTIEQCKELRIEKDVRVESHRFAGVFIARGKYDSLVTLNLTPGKDAEGEKLIKQEIKSETPTFLEYRVWNPFRSKLGASILGGIEDIHIKPGTKVLYLGAACGITISHISDIIGSDGLLYAVESSLHDAGKLLTLAKDRPNIVPIVEEASEPWRYQKLVGTVDTIYCDLPGPDQVTVLAANANCFLQPNGAFLIVISSDAISSEDADEVIYANEVKRLRENEFKPYEQLTLEPYERSHAVISGRYKVVKN